MAPLSRPSRCAAVGLDAAFLRRVREAATGLRVDPASGPGDEAVARAEVVLVSTAAATVPEVLAAGARAIVACVPHGDADAAVRALREGADDVVTPRMQGAEVAARVAAALSRRRATRELEARARFPAEGPPALVGRSPAVQRLRRILPQIAGAAVPVAFEGEPGTGRSLAARLVHDLSPRRHEPLLVVDAGASGAAAAHTLLFGGEDSCGALWSAGEGSVLVRSAERLAPRTQALVAEWLRTGRLADGPNAGEPAEARLLATVAAPLDSLAAAGAVSPELAAALSAVRVALAPVRERRGDAALLLGHFLHADAQTRTALAPGARALLERHAWPGNVPEVRAVASLLAARGPFPELDEAGLLPLLAFPRPAPAGDGALDGVPTLRDVEVGHIVRVLALAGGVRSRAAKALGISSRTIYNHLGGRSGAGPRPGRPARHDGTRTR